MAAKPEPQLQNQKSSIIRFLRLQQLGTVEATVSVLCHVHLITLTPLAMASLKRSLMSLALQP